LLQYVLLNSNQFVDSFCGLTAAAGSAA